MSSIFEVPIIKVKKRKHPNADTLSIVDVFGWQVVVKSEEFEEGSLAAYVRPDSLVDITRKEFSWLDKNRVKTRRFRQEWSHGLLIKAPDGFREGQDAAKFLGVTNYVPGSEREITVTKETIWKRLIWWFKENKNRPRGKYPHYDVEHLRRYMNLISDEEEVIITEKIHGANALYTSKRVFLRGTKVFMRSRTIWKPFIGGAGFYKDTGNIWKKALENTSGLKEATIKLGKQNLAIYGEIYGQGVQELTYGEEKPKFISFDLWNISKRQWVEKDKSFEILDNLRVPRVPILYQGKFDHSIALELANKNSTLHPKQIQEGVVVTTINVPRKQLKLISDKYLEKA